MNPAKAAGVLLALLVVLFLVVVNFSAVETRYRCEGEFARDDQSGHMVAFLKLHGYRWWVGLWGDSDGAAWIEIPNVWVEYFSNVQEVGDQLQLGEGTKLRGSFSNLSHALAVKVNGGDFKGECTSIK